MSSNIHSASQEILEKAIQKAIEGGWRTEVFTEEGTTWMVFSDGLQVTTNKYGKFYENPLHFIFNHDFAKALWGEAEHTAEIPSDDYDARDCDNCHGSWINKPYSCWEYRLQQMVIADDPIKYLGSHLND